MTSRSAWRWPGYEAGLNTSCGFQAVDLMAGPTTSTRGVPKALKAGVTSISMMNHSEKGESSTWLWLAGARVDPKITTVKQLSAIRSRVGEAA